MKREGEGDPDRAASGPVIATCVNAGYAESGLVENWFRSLDRVGLGRHARIAALDDRAHDALCLRGLPSTRWESSRHGEVSPGAVAYRRDGWRAIVFSKVEFVLELLTSGASVLFADADVVFLEDPLPELQALEVDFAIQSNVRGGGRGDRDFGPQTTCSGFYFARPVAAVREVLDFSGVDLGAYSGEQALLHERLLADRELEFEVLPRTRFPNGHYWRTVHPLRPAAVHFNWLVGVDAKVAGMKESGLWLVEEDGE